MGLITGVTGQDGSYLSEFLLEKGYDVHGIIRRSSVDFRERIAHLEGHPNFHLHYGDLADSMSLVKVIGLVQPDEIYNLAAQSHVQVSFDVPEFTADVDATGVLRVLEAVRVCGLTDTCRIYQASTSELYGKVEEVPQNENTPFHLRTTLSVTSHRDLAEKEMSNFLYSKYPKITVETVKGIYAAMIELLSRRQSYETMPEAAELEEVCNHKGVTRDDFNRVILPDED